AEETQMTKPEHAKLAIVGAGMGGMAAAAVLERMGFDVQVYEQADQFARLGAGIQVSPNLMRVLRWLGVEDQLKEVSFRPRSLVSRDAETAEITFELPFGDTIEKRYGAPYLLTHRADLHKALCSVVSAARIQFGTRRVALDLDGSQVVLSFADGTRSRVDGVIGADGVHSKVREHLLGPETPRYSGNVAYRS